MTKTCGECNWFHPPESLCRAHTFVRHNAVRYAKTGMDTVSCHKFREGEKRHQVENDNWERGGSWHAHSADHE